MDGHLLRTRSKSKSASTVFKKEDLKEAGIHSNGKEREQRNTNDNSSSNARDDKRGGGDYENRSAKEKGDGNSSKSEPPPSPRSVIAGFVAEEWKYGRVQRDSIKEGMPRC
jgi:hypothetical protein